MIDDRIDQPGDRRVARFDDDVDSNRSRRRGRDAPD
jgi:hypothetical protein